MVPHDDPGRALDGRLPAADGTRGQNGTFVDLTDELSRHELPRPETSAPPEAAPSC